MHLERRNNIKKEQLTDFTYLNRIIDCNDVVWKSETSVCLTKEVS